jgi:hypothetical protein
VLSPVTRRAYDAHARYRETSCGFRLFRDRFARDQQRLWWRRERAYRRPLQQATIPAARSGHAMAYDDARQVVLMFGGQARRR